MRWSSTPLAGCISALLSLAGLALSPSSAHASTHRHVGDPGPANPSTLPHVPLAGLAIRNPAPAVQSTPRSADGRRTTVAIRAMVRSGAARLGETAEAPVLTTPPLAAFGFLRAPIIPALARIAHPALRSRPTQTLSAAAASAPLRAPGFRVSVAALALNGFASANPAPTNVQLDTTLGQTRQPVVTTNAQGQNDFAVAGNMGSQIGGNLFFSFSSFSLATNESVTFGGPFASATPVQNIVARVTGGSSTIDGLISTSPIPGASFYLLNPSGVIFGPNARLDLGGSLAVSTASYLKLADGGRFGMGASAQDGSLSAAPPSAFGFSNTPAASVEFYGSQLTVPTGTGLHVLAGDVTLTSGTNAQGVTRGTLLNAPAGAVTIFSGKEHGGSPGEVPFDPSAPGAAYASTIFDIMGTISLANQSAITVDGAGRGTITLRGDALALDNSQLSDVNSGAISAGAITIDTISAVNLVNGAQITSSATASGAGAPISISTTFLNLIGENSLNGSAIYSLAKSGTGAAGAVTVDAFSISLNFGGLIDAYTTSAGHGAAVNVAAEFISIDGQGSSHLTGLFDDTGGTGQGGDLTIRTVTASGDGIYLANGGNISDSVLRSGNGGTLSIQTSSIQIDGQNESNFGTQIEADAFGAATGKAGPAMIDVTSGTGNIEITNGGSISTSTYGAGSTSNLTVKANSIAIDGANADLPTGILANAYESSTGQTGDVRVEVIGGGGQVSLKRSGEIAASVYGAGSTGDVTLLAKQLSIDGTGAAGLTGVLNVINGGSGNTGSLTVDVTRGAGTIDLMNGGKIAVATFDTGSTGGLKVDAKRIFAAEKEDFLGLKVHQGFTPTGIFAQAQVGSIGHAGPLVVDVTKGVGNITLEDGAQISTATFGAGDGSNLSLRCRSLVLRGYSLLIDEFGNVREVQQSSVDSSTQAGSTGKGGNVVIEALAGPGSILLQRGGVINTTTDNDQRGGLVYVEARQLTLDGENGPLTTGISAACQPAGTKAGGDLTVDVIDHIGIRDGAEITDGTFGAGNGGKMTVRASSLTIDGANSEERSGFITGIVSASGSQATGSVRGSSGGVTVDITRGVGSIELYRGGQINTATFGHGDAGSLTVHAHSLLIDSVDFQTGTGIFGDAEPGSAGRGGTVTVEVAGGLGAVVVRNFGTITVEAFGTGLAGSLFLQSNSLAVQSGAEIVANTAGPSKGGNVVVNTQTLLIDGSQKPELITGITALSERAATGAAGSVSIFSRAIQILGSGEISSDTFSSGRGGNVTVEARTLRIDGEVTPQFPTGIFAQSHTGSTASAGDVTVQIGGELVLQDGGEIAASTFTAGAAGRVTVTAENLKMDGSGSVASDGASTGIFDQSLASGRGGPGGELSVSARDSLVVLAGADIGAETHSSGQGGDISISAGHLLVDGVGGGNLLTGVSAASRNGGTGNAGSVNVSAGDIVLRNGGTLSSASELSNAGSLNVAAQTNITVQDRASISATAGDNGGNIEVTANGLVSLLRGSITATAGTQHDLAGLGGTGGNIAIDPEFIVLDGALISASALAGRGGNILLETANFLPSESLITATGSTNGTIDIVAPELDLTNGLVRLTAALLNNGNQLREQCARRLNQDFSSFLILGQGGVETSPEEAQPDVSPAGKRKRRPEQAVGGGLR